ncbi:hypothetical protein LR48_Vigan07g188200 [Vigna angularis]|uniref:Uncharacterized protein n=1 Tax=Phaseolus angularis TaxID=3914 RepID=A0A0L9UZH0_PHAAN|nr:hypothetical protein LR48_Vigan07g188200 [Vigna angularis]
MTKPSTGAVSSDDGSSMVGEQQRRREGLGSKEYYIEGLKKKQPNVGASMICVLSGGNDLTATVWRWRDRRRLWEDDAKSTAQMQRSLFAASRRLSGGGDESTTKGFEFREFLFEDPFALFWSVRVVDGCASRVAMGVSVASIGVLRRLRGMDWQRREEFGPVGHTPLIGGEVPLYGGGISVGDGGMVELSRVAGNGYGEISVEPRDQWQGWLSSWQNEGNRLEREAELIVQIINVMVGYWSEELRLNPQYQRLLQTTNRVCHGLRNYQISKAHDSGSDKRITCNH